MTSVTNARELEDCMMMQLQIRKRYPVNACILDIFKNGSKAGCICASSDGFELTAKALKVMPYHIQVCVFEYLSVDCLLEMLKIDHDSCENIDIIQAVKKAIKMVLEKILPRDWLERYALEDVLDVFIKLYNLRNSARYTSPSLNFFNNVNSLHECIKLFIASPLMVIEILHITLRQEEVLELDVELMLNMILSGEAFEPNNRDSFVEEITDQCLLLEEVVDLCVLMVARYSNVRILELLMFFEFEVHFSMQQEMFWRLLIEYYSRDFMRRLLEIKCGYPILDIINEKDTIIFFRQIILSIIRAEDVEFVREVILRIPEGLKEAVMILSHLEEYIEAMVEQNCSDELLRNLEEVVLFLLEMGFR